MGNKLTKWIGFMGDEFAKEIQGYVGVYSAQPIQQYIMAKIREKFGLGFTKNNVSGKIKNLFTEGPKSRRRMMALSSRAKQARSRCLLTEASLSPQSAALVLAIEGEGFRFRCD